MKKLFPLFLLFAACASGPQENATDTTTMTPVNEVQITREEGFASIQLSIASKVKKDSASLLHISSIYHGKKVGFDVLVPLAEKSGFGHGMILSSTGVESDNFLAMLAEEYHIAISGNEKFCKSDTISFDELDKMEKIIAAQGNETVTGNKMKLFFEALRQNRR